MKVELKCVKRPDGLWWILGAPDNDVGGYDTKAEADEAAKGVRRFYRDYVNSDGSINNRSPSE